MTLEDKYALEEAGFVQERGGWTRIDDAGERTEFIGMTGPHGRWYACSEWWDVIRNRTIRKYLRGPRCGMRLFKSAPPLIAAVVAKRLQETV